ncbi:hypothetical protein PT974_08865 [Cladobotryum mycophilum]|uniref:Uncharacterized protein n=1 Tax=Cladobotryum mycophilum TaxID=491253 RepID=A0ABR0SEQ1_9HYPO
MPIRNPFARRSGLTVITDENVRPGQDVHLGFERVDTVGSKASSILSVRSAKSQDTGEYKMSVVNDSGVYLPPSPTEDKGRWPRKHMSSRASTDTRSSFGDIEHFSISRESFDSYRRSFDISARSPIGVQDVPTRQSLDSARFPRLPRSAIDQEAFEDVGLDDHKQQPRKRGFFAKLTDSQDKEKDKDKDSAPQTNVSRFLIPGRKRGQSGQGAELGNIDQIKAATAAAAE